MPDPNSIANWDYNVQEGVADKQAAQQMPEPIPASTIPAVPGYKPQPSQEDTMIQQSLGYVQKAAESDNTIKPSYPDRAFVGDTTRYPSMFPYENNANLEESFGNAQTTGQKLLYGGALAGGALVKGAADMLALVTDTAYMIGGAADGKGVINKQFYDNNVNKLLADWKTSYDAQFPIYQTQAQANTYLPTANTLPNFMKLLGTLGGMALGTKGLGLLGKVSQLGRLVDAGAGIIDARYMGQVAKLSEFAEGQAATEAATDAYTKAMLDAGNNARAAENINAGLDGVTKAINESKAALDNSYAQTMGTYTAAMQKAGHLVVNLGMASAMGYEGRKNYIDKMTEQIRAEGREPSDAEMAKINEYADSVGNTTALLTGAMGALTLSGFVDGVLGKTMFKNAAREEAEGIVAKTASGEVGDIAGSKFANTIDNEITYGKETFKATAEGKIGKFGQNAWDKVKRGSKWTWDRVDIPAGFTMAEFGIAGSSVDNYYEKKYKDPDANVWSDGVLPNIKALASADGVSTIIMGALGASLLEGLSGYKKGLRTERDKLTQTTIDALNKGNLSQYMIALGESANRMGDINGERIQALRVGDLKTANDKIAEATQNYLYPRITAGLKMVVDNDINGYRKLAQSDEGIQTLRDKGMIPQDGDILKVRKDFLDSLDKTQRAADNADKYYKALKTKFGGDPRYGKEHIEKMMYLSGMTDDATERIGTLNKELHDSPLKGAVSDSKDTFNAERLLDNLYPAITQVGADHRMVKDLIDGIRKQVDKLPILETDKQDIYQKLGDMVQLAHDRNGYLKLYQDMVYNPEGYAEYRFNSEQKVGTVDVPEVVRLKPVRTKNDNPVEFEVGADYYAGETVVTGISDTDTAAPFRKFSKFKVIGEEEVDGKRKIVIQNEKGQQASVDEATFSKYKVGRVDALDKPENHNAKYWFNNRNSIYEFNMGNKGRKRGRLNYDADTDEFSFVYSERNSKTGKLERKVETISKADFRGRDIKNDKGEIVSKAGARLRKIGEITEADKEWLDTKQAEKDNIVAEKLAAKKTEIITKHVNSIRETLKGVEDDILDHEIKIEAVQKQLEEVRKGIEESRDIRQDRKTNAFKKGLRALFGSTDTLSKTLTDLQDSHSKLSEQSDDLQYEIDYLNDISVRDLPHNTDLLKYIDNLRKGSEDLLLDTGNKINTISKILDKARNALRRIIDTVLDYIKTFETLYPDFPHSDDKALRDFVNKENNFAQDQNIPGYFETNPDVFRDLDSLKKIIAGAEEAEIPLKERDIKAAEKELTELYQLIKDTGKDLKIQNNLYDVFTKEKEVYDRAQKRQELLNSPAYKERLRYLQRGLNTAYEGVDPHPVDITKRVYAPASKPVSKVFRSTIQLPEHVTDNNFFQKRANNFTKNANLGFNGNTGKEGYVAVNPEFKVIIVSKQNQSHYFGDKPLIENDYLHPDGTRHSNGSDNPIDAAVACVRVYKDTDGRYKFVDENGKVLGDVLEGKADPAQVIYELMETAHPERLSSYEKTHAPKGMSPEDTAAYMKAFRDQALPERTKIVQYEGTSRFYDYDESIGLGNYDKDAEGKRVPLENSVAFANIIPEEKIGAGVIVIPTEKEGNKIQVGNKVVPASTGKPMLVYNNNVIYLDGKKLYKEGQGDREVNHMYNVLKAFAESREQNGIPSSVYSDYLRGVMYFSDKVDAQKGISSYQMWMADGALAFKMKPDGAIEYIPFTTQDIADNEGKLKEWLQQTYHGISTTALGKPFTEIIAIKQEGGKSVPVTRKWSSYEQYLLSENTPDGEKREERLPFTTNIKGGPDEIPFKNKYITPDFKSDYFPEPDIKITEPAKPAEQVNTAINNAVNGDVIRFKGKDINIAGVEQSREVGQNNIKFKAEVVDGKIKVTVTDIKAKEGIEATDAQLAAGKKAFEEGLDKILTEIYQATPTKSADSIKFKGSDILIDGSTQSREVGPVTVTYSAIPVDGKIEVTAHDIKSNDNTEIAPELAETKKKEFEKGLSDKLTDLYKPAEAKVEVVKPIPTKAETENELEDFLKQAKSIKKRNVDFSEISPLDIIEKTEDIPALKEYIEAVVPKLKFEELPEFIKTGTGTNAYGSYSDHYIKLWSGAPEGEGMHEIYHGVEDSFLKGKEIQDIRNEFKARTGSYTDRFGREIKYSEATEKDIRERLANEFKQYKKETPGYTINSKVGNFFRRVYNFIKEFVFGDPAKIQDIFKRINSGYYKDSSFVKKPTGTDYSEMSGMTEAEKKYILHGFYNRIIDTLQKSNGGLVKLADGMSEEQVFEPLFQAMDSYYGAPTEDSTSNIWLRASDRIDAINASDLSAEQKARYIETIKAEAKGARDIWNKVAANEKAVKEDLKSYMRKYKLVFRKDITPKEIEENDRADKEANDFIHGDEDTQNNDYESNMLTYDAKDNAGLAVKLLFSNITATDGTNPNLSAEFGYNELQQPSSRLSPFLLPELLSGTGYMNKVLDEMAGTTNPELIQKRLFEMAKKDPALVRLYNSVYKEPKTQEDWRLRIAFSQFAGKVKPDSWFLHFTEDGQVIVKNANTDTDAHGIVEQWESDFRGDNSGLTAVQDGIYKADTRKLINPAGSSDAIKLKNTTALLEQLHFPTDNIKSLSAGDKAKLVIATGKLYNRLREGIAYKEISSRSLDISAVGEVARILSGGNSISTASSRQNMDGNTVVNHILPNTITRMMEPINQARSLNELYQINPTYKNDIWIRNSQLLKPGGQLFAEDGTKREGAVLNMSIIDGASNPSFSYKPKIGMGDVNNAVRSVISMNMNLEGIYSFFIAADSQTEAGTKVKNYITSDQFRHGTMHKDFSDIATKYLEDEIDLIKANISGERVILSGAHENDNCKKLQVFKDILPNYLVKRITDYANKPGEVDTKEFIKSVQKEVNDALKQYIDNSAEAQKKQFEDSLVLVYLNSSKKFKFHGMNTDFLKSVDIKSNILTDEQVKDILSYRTMNLFIHGTEMRKLFYGPWYEVSDAPKRDKTAQSGTITSYNSDKKFNLWQNQNQYSGDVNLVEGDFGHRNFTDNYSQVIFAEPQSESRIYDAIAAIIGKDAAGPYKSIDEMDAQGIVRDTAWKEYKIRSGGRWTEADEAQNQYDLASARQAHYQREGIDSTKYRSELKAADESIIAKGNPHTKDTGNPEKPLGSGMQTNDMQSMPYLDKTSIYRLTYPIAKDRGLEDLYWFMHDNGVDITGPKSMAKFGRPYIDGLKDGLPALYDKEGMFNLGNVTPEQKEQWIQELPVNTYNKIVETAKNSEGRSRATQPLSLITVNTHNSGIPVDIWNGKGDLKQAEEEWNNLSEKQKRTKSDLYRLWDDNNKAIIERSQRGYEDTLHTYGITEKDGSYTFNDPERLVKYLRSEITRRDMPDNISAGLDWYIDGDGQEKLLHPLEAMANYQQLNNILWSVATKNILKPKMNGTDNILMSSTGFGKKGISRMETKDGKSVLVSSDLKYYEKGKDGKSTSLAQVYAPNHLLKELKAAKSELTDAELFKYLNTKEGKELVRAVGFRIPTQGLNSIDAIEIVPWDAANKQFFMPAEMGNAVIVPSELVTKVGLDFDVDKMPTYHFNFYVDKDGYPRKINFIEDTTSDKSLERLYKSKYSGKERREIAASRLMSGITDIEGIGEDVPTLAEFIKANKGGDPWKLNSTEAIENKYFDTMMELLTHPHNYEQLVTPNSTAELVGVFNDISKRLRPDKDNRNKKDVNYSNLLDPVYLNKERQDYRDATGQSIGIGAQNNTFHALAQLKYLPIQDDGTVTDPTERKLLGDFKIYLPHNKVKYGNDWKTVLSGLTSSNGRYISDYISQVINGAVDAVKDKWLIELLQNKELLSTATFLGRTGVDADYVFNFLNQPIIQQFVKLEGIYRDVRMVNPEIGYVSAEDLIAKVMKMTYPDGPEKTSTRDMDFKLEDFQKVLDKVGEGKELKDLSAPQREMQRQVLQEYLKYRLLSQHALKEQMGLLTANMQRLNDTNVEFKGRLGAHAKTSSALGVMSKMDGKTYNSAILDMAAGIKEAKSQITPISAYPALAEINSTFTNPELRISGDKREQAINNATLSLIDYASQVHASEPLNKDIKRLLVDNTSAANLLTKVRSEAKGDMKELFKSVLNNLQSIIQIGGKDVKTVKLTSKPAIGIEADIITEAMRTLRDNPVTNELYRELLKNSFVQSGISNSRGSYHGYLPNEDIVAFMKPVIDKLLTEDMSAFNSTNAFYRNSWFNKDIVPAVKKTQDMNSDTKSYKFYKQPEQLDRLQEKLQKQLTAAGVVMPKLMARGERFNGKDLKYPVLQFSEDVNNPATGHPYSTADRKAMANKGDYSFQKVGLLQKVIGQDGEPLVIATDKGAKIYLYKQVNAWGDGSNAQEYYDHGRPSVLDKHGKVLELSDTIIEKAFKGTLTNADVKAMESADTFVPSPKTIQGENISSNSKGLAAALTNPTELAKRKGNLAQSYPIEYKGKSYPDVEAAYQANKAPYLKSKTTGELMTELITKKLETYPKLVEGIKEKGGVDYLEKSTHKVTGDNYWETGEGKSNGFMKALIDAYKKVTTKTYTKADIDNLIKETGAQRDCP